MNELIFYLIGCVVMALLIIIGKDKPQLNLGTILIVALSWVAVILSLIVLVDKHYKSIENK